MNTPGSYLTREIDISESVTNILKTVLLLDRPYGTAYITRIVQGSSQYGWRKEAHTSLETFGSMDEVSFIETEMTIRWLVKHKYLRVLNQQYGTLDTTELGTGFLSAPKSIFVQMKELKRPWYEWELLRSLRKIRKNAASSMECEPYEVFTNYLMTQLIDLMPDSPEKLQKLNGISSIPDPVQQAIIAAIQSIALKKEKADGNEIYERAYSYGHQVVKEMYLAGMSLEAIAEKRNVQENTILGYLERLHLAGEINLRPWIEDQIESQDLHKCSEYFSQVTSPKLKEAHEVLGIDYRTLIMGRIYVAKVEEPILKYAS